VAIYCDICGDIITDEYIQDFWENKYHKHHVDEYESCKYCQRLICNEITGGGIQYRDGRNICGICLEKAITTGRQAVQLLEKVRDQLAINDIFVTEKINLQLVNIDRLKKICGSHLDKMSGCTTCETKNVLSSLQSSTSNSQNFDIYILNGLPRMDFIWVVAHEMMHVWLCVNGSWAMDDTLREGNCNYASYLVLKENPGKESDFIIRNMNNSDNEIYGNGFRRVRRYAENHGIKRWLSYIRENKNLPDDY
jgi:hypothetical protein